MHEPDKDLIAEAARLSVRVGELEDRLQEATDRSARSRDSIVRLRERLREVREERRQLQDHMEQLNLEAEFDKRTATGFTEGQGAMALSVVELLLNREAERCRLEREDLEKRIGELCYQQVADRLTREAVD